MSGHRWQVTPTSGKEVEGPDWKEVAKLHREGKKGGKVGGGRGDDG